jgi:hypothetical protein
LGGGGLQEIKFMAGDGVGALESAVYMWRQKRLLVLMLIPKDIDGRFHSQPLHRFHKMRPVRSPPKLAIGDGFQTRLLL